jgi:hypothetical protein
MPEDRSPIRLSHQVDLLLLDQIDSIVQRAAAVGGTLQIAPHAKRLSASFGSAGLSQKSIADELMMIAAQAGVPVEIDHSDRAVKGNTRSRTPQPPGACLT